MSKFTLGQRQFPTMGLRSQQPKNYVGPTLSCYLGYWAIRVQYYKVQRWLDVAKNISRKLITDQ